MSLHRVLEAAHGLALVSLNPPSPNAPPFHVSARDVVCGDFVRLDDTRARVVEVLPRRSALTRARLDGDDDNGVQIICANVDIVAICAPLDRPVSARFLERGVAVAHASNARPLVLLTKRDTLVEGDALPLGLAGVDVLAVSAHDADDLDVVRAFIAPGETMALLGASGAGKSTLANALLGPQAEQQRTGDVRGRVGGASPPAHRDASAKRSASLGRAGDARGRHTTTGARLLTLPWGAFLVDTAGVRTLGLAGDESDVSAAFPDIDALAAGCRFRDCAHGEEPGCAVRGAVDDARLASFHALLREAKRRGRAPWEHSNERALSIAGWERARDKRR